MNCMRGCARVAALGLTLALLAAGARAGTASAAPVNPGAPTVEITPFSPVVTGNIGSPIGRVTVQVTLIRAGAVIDGASAVTGADGAWAATLPAHTPADPPDEVDVAYSGAGAPPSSRYAHFIGGSSGPAAITAAGDRITISCASLPFSCSGPVPVTVSYGNRAPATVNAPWTGPGSYAAALAPAVSANDAVSFVVQGPWGDGSYLALHLDAGLPGASAPATCSADLVLKTVSCSPLPAGVYTLADFRGGAAVAGATVTAGAVQLPGLLAGDQITLSVPAAGTEPARTLTTLAVYPLRADIVERDLHLDPSGTAGSCRAGEYSPSLAALCSAAGSFTSPQSGWGRAGAPLAFEDETSGGSTVVSVPYVYDTSPIDNELVPPSWVAYADAATLGGGAFDGSKISLTLQPLGGGAPYAVPGNANSGSGVPVSALAPGRYAATWTLTDANGDTD